ncbi:MAG: hypothetical protein AAGI37_14115 [Planctomycetota bacterium]
MLLKTSIDEVTHRLEQVFETLDERRDQDLGLTEIEGQLTSVRDTIQPINKSFESGGNHAL